MKKQHTRKDQEKIEKFASVSEASQKLSHGTYTGTAPSSIKRKSSESEK